ncbi:Pentalenene oxygenase [Posidoniimonas corsicana]|uniref:Pentalenene oxygenase n=1 Tax=Posidoniimonas corsicana TaxID=1938618 RepID=A0A5C5VG57_9BACT|nr:cytochrome P450 [Posidoniimonas corsicana]TWT36927.1 Pentalenene oxygenase [Posidoniimonas corsicana]
MARSDPRTFDGSLAATPWSYRLWMLAGSRERFFETLTQEFGDFVRYRGVLSFYLVNHPALVKQVLQETNRGFDKNSPLYDRFRRAFGDGLVVAEGDQWKRSRAVVQRVMGPGPVRSYFDLMVGSADTLAAEWTRAAREEAVFDAAPEMDRLTLEVIGRALFEDGFDEAADSIRRWTQVIDHYSSKAPLPIVRSAWFPSTLNLRLGSTLREFHGFIQAMIDRARAAPAGGGLLSMLCQPAEDSDLPRLSDKEIRDEALGMIVGGHETSSVALTWIWYELSRHPEVEARLHEELDGVLGNGPLAADHLPRLVYTKMVIDETLRLHPPFWFENRNVMREVQLGGQTLPAGTMVAFSRYALHRHPGFWTDPEAFDPERFRPGAEENPRSTHAYVPFGGGPRVCVGVHFAVQELVVLLASLASRFRVQVDSSHRHAVSALLTMRPKHGLRVRVTQRRPGTDR